MVALERAVNQKDAKRYLQEYSIKLGPGDDASTEQRGVMVIKCKNKTRAKQRKGAVSNWKVSNDTGMVRNKTTDHETIFNSVTEGRKSYNK